MDIYRVNGAGPGQHRRVRQPGQPPGQQGDNLLQHDKERGDCGLVIFSTCVWIFYQMLGSKIFLKLYYSLPYK